MEKIKNWLSQRTTWVGIASVIISIVIEVAPEYTQLVAGVFAALGILVPGKLPQKAAPLIIPFIAVSLTAMSACSSFQKVGDKEVDTIVEAGCIVAATAGCFNDYGVSVILGDLKTSAQCVKAVHEAIDAKVIPVDVGKLQEAIQAKTCESFMRAFIPPRTSYDYELKNYTTAENINTANRWSQRGRMTYRL